MTTKLVIVSGKSAGKTIAIKRDQLLVGRAEECDVRPLSDEVSRRHCAVRIEPDVVWVEDLGSRNGTFVNGNKITEKTKVFDGDVIKVGNLELRVSGGTERKETPAAASPASWNDEDEVSRWLLADSTASGIIHDTTQTSAVPTPVDPSGPDHASPEADRSGVTRINIDELKASRTHPSGLPQEAKKTVASSREAAAEALKKLFGNR
ncbi:MAG: FHA domain-containing protein [Planctomycetia bacterium]